MHKLLTNRLVETVKPGLKRLEIRDASFAGFSLRVTENGRKTFGYAYRWGLEQRRERLGTYPATTLARAREKAVAIQRLVEEGIDPTAKRRATIVTVEDAVADFIRIYAKPRNKSWQEAERTLTRELTSAYATRDIRSITRADILESSMRQPVADQLSATVFPTDHLGLVGCFLLGRRDRRACLARFGRRGLGSSLFYGLRDRGRRHVVHSFGLGIRGAPDRSTISLRRS